MASAAAAGAQSFPRGFDGIEDARVVAGGGGGGGGSFAFFDHHGDDEDNNDNINDTMLLDPETTSKVSSHVLPWLFGTSLTCYLDRGNIAYAAAQLNRDLGFSRRVYGIGSGVFFITYILLEIPSNIFLVRVGPARWLSRILITWGIAASAMVLTTNAASFYAIRLLLGAAEAGAYPGMVVALTRWFGHQEFPSRYATVCQVCTELFQRYA